MADIAIMARVLEAPSRYNLQLLHFLGKWLALLACSGAARRSPLEKGTATCAGASVIASGFH
ncbi:hypothetical protein K0M31_013519 [Melipona bicolor]|uniref:Uncharacterized protein n=1 Tax=Melipona bicolor TaxID=60889 RepID=A0AA40FHS3_9HYME|nr:hypothetical protein K0M31_013519 [Melipona bicolor]